MTAVSIAAGLVFGALVGNAIVGAAEYIAHWKDTHR